MELPCEMEIDCVPLIRKLSIRTENNAPELSTIPLGVTPPNLSSLPVELRCRIVRRLDPVGLIALSHSSRLFRGLIQPTKHHFMQRLLQMELMPAFGGSIPAPIRGPRMLSDWADPSVWSSRRYACARCRKLLSHRHFDTPSISDVRMRKPSPGDREADRVQLTDWDPVARTQVWLGSGLSLDWPDVFCNTGSTMDGVLPDEDDLDVQRWLSGRDRAKRLCIQCQYGAPRSSLGLVTLTNVGTADFPVIWSRDVYMATDVERCFPGLFDKYPRERTPLVPGRSNWSLMRQGVDLSDLIGDTPSKDIRSKAYTLAFGRCRKCGVWRELANFRTMPMAFDGGKLKLREFPGSTFIGRALDGICNRCVEQAPGWGRYLATLISQFACDVIKLGTDEIRERMCCGWLDLEHNILTVKHSIGDPDCQYSHTYGCDEECTRGTPDKQWSIFREVTAGLPWASHPLQLRRKVRNYSYNKAHIRLKQEATRPDDLLRRMQLFYDIAHTKLTEEERDSWEFKALSQTRWVDDFERNIELLKFLQACKQKIMDISADELVDYALRREPWS